MFNKKITIRDLLLLVFTVVWIVAAVVSLVQTGKVPAELWAVFTGAIGLILAAFRTPESSTSDVPSEAGNTATAATPTEENRT